MCLATGNDGWERDREMAPARKTACVDVTCGEGIGDLLSLPSCWPKKEEVGTIAHMQSLRM